MEEGSFIGFCMNDRGAAPGRPSCLRQGALKLKKACKEKGIQTKPLTCQGLCAYGPVAVIERNEKIEKITEADLEKILKVWSDIEE